MGVKCLLVYVIMMTTRQVINGHKLRPVYKKLAHLEDAIYSHRAHWKNEMKIFHNVIERKFLNRVVRETLPKLIEKKLLDILKSGVLDIAVDDYNYQRIDRMYRQHQLIKVHLNWTYRQIVGAIALVRRSNQESKELTRQIKSLQTSVNGFKSIFNEIREENVRLKQTLSGIENQVMGLSACFPADTSCAVAKDRSTRVVSINTWDPALTTEYSSGYTEGDVGHDELLSTFTPDPAVHTLSPTTDVTDSFSEELEDEKLITLIPRHGFAATVVTEALVTAAEDRLIPTTKTQTSTPRPGDAVRDILSLIKN